VQALGLKTVARAFYIHGEISREGAQSKREPTPKRAGKVITLLKKQGHYSAFKTLFESGGKGFKN
jgi:hypothetical protein